MYCSIILIDYKWLLCKQPCQHSSICNRLLCQLTLLLLQWLLAVSAVIRRCTVLSMPGRFTSCRVPCWCYQYCTVPVSLSDTGLEYVLLVQAASHQMQHRLLGFLEEHGIVWKGAFDLVDFKSPSQQLYTLKMRGLGEIMASAAGTVE